MTSSVDSRSDQGSRPLPEAGDGMGVSWQEELRRAYREPAELGRELRLPTEMIQAAELVQGEFPLFAPRPFVSRMEKGRTDDPLLLQIWPRASEGVSQPGFVPDPVLEAEATRLPGVIQKYAGRALLVLNGVCAVHCRYCFRRHFPYADVPRAVWQWEPVLNELAQDATIQELILSGGDPLSMRDEGWSEWVERLLRMPHLRRVRVHTRWPVVIPQRVTDEWLVELTRLPQPVVVIHANHARELDDQVAGAVRRMLDAGALVLNQAVLLRDVNDNVDTLVELSERLIEIRVMPYYLNELDRVAGSWEFEVTRSRALELMAGLEKRLPGYAVPRLVRDEPGGSSKQRVY